mgnify:FL=1
MCVCEPLTPGLLRLAVFVFFEDGMTVRIGQAVGAQDFETVGALIKWGTVGGAMCGLMGALISTIVTFIETIFQFFVPERQVR